MKTEKVAGKEVSITIADAFASLPALSRIMDKEFGEKSAYRIGRLRNELESIVKAAEKDRLSIFEIYGKKDGKGNITIPPPGEEPVRAENEDEEDFSQRIAGHKDLVKNNEAFKNDMEKLFKNERLINVPPLILPAGFTITTADRMALTWLSDPGSSNLMTDITQKEGAEPLSVFTRLKSFA